MANEIRYDYGITGKTIYGWMARPSDGQVYNGSTFEAIVTGHWSTYAVTVSEQGTTGVYYGTMPGSLPAGWYDIFFRLQAGGSPATTDAAIGHAVIQWTGTVDSSGIAYLPQAASATSGGLPTLGTGAGQINVDGAGNVSGNLVNIAGSAVSTTTAQLGVNAVKYNNQVTQTDANNLPKVDVEAWKAGLVPAPNVTGEPLVDVNHWRGTQPNVLVSNRVDVSLGANNAGNLTADVQTIKTQTVTCAAGVTVGAFVGNATAAIVVNASGQIQCLDSYGNKIAGDVVASGTAQAGAGYANSRLNVSSATNMEIGDTVEIYSGTSNGDKRTIAGLSGTTITPDRNFTSVLDGTSLYVVRRANEFAMSSAAITWAIAGNGYPQVDVHSFINNLVMCDTNGTPYVDVSGIAGIAVNLDASVGSSITQYPYLGTTQPVNFTGTGASALVQADTRSIKGTTSTGTAGYVGIDWGHINAPTTTVNLSGTTVATVTNAVTLPANPPAGFLIAASYGTAPAWYTTPPTTSAIATAVLTDTGDNTTAHSPGKILSQLDGALVGSVYTVAALANAPSGGGGGGGSDPWATTQPGSYAAGTYGFFVSTQLAKLSTGVIQVVNNLSANGTITLMRNSDNYYVDGRSVLIAPPSLNFWPNLTAATVTLYVDNGALAVGGTVLTPTGSQVVYFEPTAAQTDSLADGLHNYVAWATLSNGHKIGLAYGSLVMLDDMQAT